MSSESQTTAQQTVPHKGGREWLWRFLAFAMLFSICWVLWIAYQLNPPPLVMSAALEAAAKARANPATGRDAASKTEAVAPNAAEAPKAEAEAPKPAVAEVAKEPPVNVEKLKLSDSITAPVAQDAKKK